MRNGRQCCSMLQHTAHSLSIHEPLPKVGIQPKDTSGVSDNKMHLIRQGCGQPSATSTLRTAHAIITAMIARPAQPNLCHLHTPCLLRIAPTGEYSAMMLARFGVTLRFPSFNSTSALQLSFVALVLSGAMDQMSLNSLVHVTKLMNPDARSRFSQKAMTCRTGRRACSAGSSHLFHREPGCFSSA